MCASMRAQVIGHWLLIIGLQIILQKNLWKWGSLVIDQNMKISHNGQGRYGRLCSVVSPHEDSDVPALDLVGVVFVVLVSFHFLIDPSGV